MGLGETSELRESWGMGRGEGGEAGRVLVDSARQARG